MEEQQKEEQSFKYFCRVCKKGFMSGRALGGHMRAHGNGDVNGYVDEDDEDRGVELDGDEGNKRMHQLRTNSNRFKSCKNCGKEFLSWKSFLEHAKCTSDDVPESIVSFPESDGDEDDRVGGGWFKRKRSLRSTIGSTYLPIEDDDILLARCLVELANTVVVSTPMEREESCASASREEERRNRNLLGQSLFDFRAKGVSISSPKGVFECKECKKVFNSHQALGGHRASHKKFKGCFATKMEETLNPIRQNEAITNKELTPFIRNDYNIGIKSIKKKTRIHECSICHLVFPSGQALGGHKRCHWILSNTPTTSSIPPKFPPLPRPPKLTLEISQRLDLNVPAWAHFSGVRRDPNNPLTFEVPTGIHLRVRGELNNKNRNKMVTSSENNGGIRMEDEADSNMKMVKMANLNELNKNGESSQWLQIGIGTTAQSGTPAACDL